MIERSDYLKLLTFLNQIEVKSIAEIGVWLGLNAQELRYRFPEAHLYLIDPWELSQEYLEKGFPPDKNAYFYQRAYEHTKQLFRNDKNVTILRKTSMEALSLVPDNIDLVFIDGDHSYEAIKQDIQGWGKKVRPGGLLSGHDFHPVFPGVIQAVQESFGNNFQLGDDNVWSIIKT